jgi:foldase protein PrsA
VTRTPHRLGAGALLIAGVLALAGCQTGAGAAAVVGGSSISTDSLTKMVDRALADPQAKAQLGADRAGFTRQELARLINAKIVDAAAKKRGVTASQSEIDAQIKQLADQYGGQAALEQQAAASGVPKQDLEAFVRTIVLENKLADKLVEDVPVDPAKLEAAYKQGADNYDQVHSAHILVKDKKTADSILAQVKANPSSFAELAKKYSIDTGSKDNGGDLGFAGRSKFVKEFATAIFTAKPGQFVEVHTQFGWHVIHVIEHKTISLEQATPELKRSVLKDERSNRLRDALVAEAKALHVKVNPRFGRFDVSTGEVVAPDNKGGVSTPSASPGAGGSGG